MVTSKSALQRLEAVSSGLKTRKFVRIEFHHVADEIALDAGRLGHDRARLGQGDGVVAEVGHFEVAQEKAAVGMRVGAHAARAFGRQVRQFGAQAAGAVEEFRRLIAFHPAFQNPDMRRLVHVAHRHLVGAEGSFDHFSVHHLGAGPALGRAQDDHRPRRPLAETVGPRVVLDGFDFSDNGVERGGHELVDLCGNIALHKPRFVAVAAQQRLQFIMRQAGQHGRAGDLVAVEMKDGQHGAVPNRMEEFVRVPACGQRARLGFAVANHADDQQVGIIEGGAEGVGERIAQLAAFVDGTGRFGRDVAGDAARKGELFEELLHPILVLRHVGINLAVGPLQVSIGDQSRPAVARACHVDDVEVLLLDDAVEVNVDEIQSWRRAPMAQEAGFDVPALERPLEQRIVVQINLADGEIIGRPPIGVHFAEQFRGECVCLCFHGLIPSVDANVFGRPRGWIGKVPSGLLFATARSGRKIPAVLHAPAARSGRNQISAIRPTSRWRNQRPRP